MSKQRQQPEKTTHTCCDVGVLMDPAFFKALCDPNRIALLDRLAQCPEPCTVTELCCCCDVDFSVVSRHLALLRDAGICHAVKRGKQVHYSVNYTDLAARLRAMADAIDACCPSGTGECNDVHTNKPE